MSAHVTAEMLNRLGRRAVGGPELATTLRHLGECEMCARRTRAGVAARIDALRDELAGSEESPHVDPETELAQYVDGTLGAVECEIVETHLQDCSMCRGDVDDLMTVAKPRERRVRRPFFAAAAAAAAILTTVVLVSRRSEMTPRPVTDPVSVVATPPAVTARDTPVAYANADWDRLVREAVRSGRLPMADLTSIAGAPDPLRASSDRPPAALKPAGVVVEDVRPRFSWPPRDAATYVVTIFDGDEEVAQSEPLSDAQWTPRISLPRGRTYVWQVAVRSGESTAILPAPPAPPAMFRIASERDHRELAEARSLHPDDHLLHAVLAARAGLRAEAGEALRRANVNLYLP